MKAVLLAFNNGDLAAYLASSVVLEADTTLLIDEKLAAEGANQLDPSVKLFVHTKPRLREPLKQIKFVYKLVRQIRRLDPDVLHIQIGHLWFNLALPFLQKYPIVTTVHDPRDHVGDVETQKTPQFIKDYGYKSSDYIIVHSIQMKLLLIEAVGIAEDRISVVPLTALGDTSLAQEVNEEKNTLLFFGRIWEYKGLEYLIRAEPLIRKEIPDVKIVIAGRGDEFSQYESMMENPDSFIVHNKYITNELQSALFRQASVVVLPYIEATQSGVIPAAYNFAKPVVATRVGALHEQIDDEKTGYLVEPRNVEELAEKIIYLLKNDTVRRQMGANAKDKLETEWSPSAIGRQTTAVYKKAIDIKHPVLDNLLSSGTT